MNNITPELQAKLDALVAEFTADEAMKALVKRIESMPETTQHRYADYGSAIASLSGGSAVTAYIIMHAMMNNGANPIGVANGVKLFCNLG